MLHTSYFYNQVCSVRSSTQWQGGYVFVCVTNPTLHQTHMPRIITPLRTREVRQSHMLCKKSSEPQQYRCRGKRGNNSGSRPRPACTVLCWFLRNSLQVVTLS